MFSLISNFLQIQIFYKSLLFVCLKLAWDDFIMTFLVDDGGWMCIKIILNEQKQGRNQLIFYGGAQFL